MSMPTTHALAILALACYPLCLVLIFMGYEGRGLVVAVTGFVGCIGLLVHGV